MADATTVHVWLVAQARRRAAGSALTRLPAWPAAVPSTRLGLRHPQTHPAVASTIYAVTVPRSYGAVRPAEFVAWSVACHVPGGIVTCAVPVVGRWPRSRVCGELTPLGSTRSILSASHGVPGSLLCHIRVGPCSCGGAVIAGAAVSHATTSGASFTVDRRPARFVAG